MVQIKNKIWRLLRLLYLLIAFRIVSLYITFTNISLSPTSRSKSSLYNVKNVSHIPAVKRNKLLEGELTKTIARLQYKSKSMDLNKDRNSTIANEMFTIDPRLGRFDNSRNHEIFDCIFTGSEHKNLDTESLVCLATQSSVDRLHWLIEVFEHWDGAPLSVAIFVPDMEYGIAKLYLKFLLKCYKKLFVKITVSFAYPKKYPPKEAFVKPEDVCPLCEEDPKSCLKRLLQLRSSKMMKWRNHYSYPQNLLRNVARQNCGTEWVFLTDVDIIPSFQFAPFLSKFLLASPAAKCKKCAFVIPTYELKETQTFPKTRKELLKLVSKRVAQPFHKSIFKYNQFASNLSVWEAREKSHPNEISVQISHNVTRYKFFYEPFYVARNDVPIHDESFQGYGYTRNTQVYEMYLAGYSFYVLTPIFTIHWGIKTRGSRRSWREKQNLENRKIFFSVVKPLLRAQYKKLLKEEEKY